MPARPLYGGRSVRMGSETNFSQFDPVVWPAIINQRIAFLKDKRIISNNKDIFILLSYNKHQNYVTNDDYNNNINIS